MKKLLICAASLTVSVAAGAQMTPPTVQTQMARVPGAPMDQGGGRVQTRDEVITKMRVHFAKFDTNRDGFIDSNELAAMHGNDRHRANGDMATREGSMGDPGSIFDQLDANHDGKLSRDEFAKGRERKIDRKVVMNGGAGGEDGPGGEHHNMMHAHQMGSHLLKMADTNSDGRISLQEMTAMALQRFDRVDANHDGKITPEERKAMRHPGL